MSSTVRLTHIGGPTVLIEFAGWRILSDPTFDPPGRRYKFGWGTASNKVAGPSMSVAELGPLDAVLLTHDHHADNLDEAGRAMLADVPIVVTTVAGAGRLGGGAIGLAPWATVTLEGGVLHGDDDRPSIDVVATPCRHGPPLSHPIVGDVIGFGLSEHDSATTALWVSGDTVLFDGVREVADRLHVDVALVHLGGVRFPITGPVHYTMTIDDGVELCRSIRPRVAIPVHYEGWSHFRQGRDAIERQLQTESTDIQQMFEFLELGVTTDLNP
jgi:L-ascorbate metabolism protein UlaG (beta-lactamase superfamily)